MRRWRYFGNARRVADENQLVHAISELMDVIQDLCRFAAAFGAVGRVAWTEALVEQCADLLSHRARLVASAASTTATGGAASDGSSGDAPRGLRWTN
jgi:hypothetical protein